MNPLTEAVVFVTGAGRGIGRAIAVACAEQGARVAAQDISPVNLDETMELICAAGPEGLELVGDMSKKMQVQSMIETAREKLGEIDVLVNQGTVAPAAGLLTIDEWDWDRTLGVNLKGYFLSIQSIGRLMWDRGQGLILNLIVPPTRYSKHDRYPAFEVSAAGIRGLTDEAARELGSQGIQVLAVEVDWGNAQLEASHRSGTLDDLTWWQRNPEKIAALVVDLCIQPDQVEHGSILLVDNSGLVSE